MILKRAQPPPHAAVGRSARAARVLIARLGGARAQGGFLLLQRHGRAARKELGRRPEASLGRDRAQGAGLPRRTWGATRNFGRRGPPSPARRRPSGADLRPRASERARPADEDFTRLRRVDAAAGQGLVDFARRVQKHRLGPQAARQVIPGIECSVNWSGPARGPSTFGAPGAGFSGLSSARVQGRGSRTGPGAQGGRGPAPAGNRGQAPSRCRGIRGPDRKNPGRVDRGPTHGQETPGWPVGGKPAGPRRRTRRRRARRLNGT